MADHVERLFGGLFHLATLLASPVVRVFSVLGTSAVRLRDRICDPSRLTLIPDSDPNEVVSRVGIVRRLSGRAQDLGLWILGKLAQVAEGFEIAFEFIFVSIPRRFSGRKSDSMNLQKERQEALQKGLAQPGKDLRNVADLVELPVYMAANVGERTLVATARRCKRFPTVSEQND